MGLAGRRTKQRIARDPRNLGWAQDAEGFGQRMLQRQGWTPGTGLGLAGAGSPDAVGRGDALAPGERLGLGSDRKLAAEDSYHQMAVFESVLARLNAAAQQCEAEDAALESSSASSTSAGPSSGSESDASEASVAARSTKRKRAAENDSSASDDASSTPSTAASDGASDSASSSSEEDAPRPAAASRRLAHRSKFIRSKAVASYTPEQLREIFG